MCKNLPSIAVHIRYAKFPTKPSLKKPQIQGYVSIINAPHQDPSFLQKNPFGLTPLLEDKTCDPPLIMYESRAIVRYLASVHGQGKLLPSKDDNRAVAKFEQAASVEVTTFDVVANRLVFELYFKG